MRASAAVLSASSRRVRDAFGIGASLNVALTMAAKLPNDPAINLPRSLTFPSISISSLARNGGAAGVVSSRAGAFAGISKAFLSRKVGDRRRKGATSAVVSTQSNSPLRGIALIT